MDHSGPCLPPPKNPNFSTSTVRKQEASNQAKMATTNKELKPQQIDRISDLPDGVQIHILSLLDTRDAVRTGVLSRRWHRVWADVKLHLIGMDNPKMLSLYQTLCSHPFPTISKFHLKLDNCELVGSKMVDLLVGHNAARHVEDLSLYVLPKYLYYQRSLRELTTAFCNFFPDGRVNWKSLRVLNVGVGYVAGKIEDVLSGCPSLESLSMCRVRFSGMHIVHQKLKRLLLNNSYFDVGGDYGELEFPLTAPQLEEFEILGDWVWTSCKMIDTLSWVCVRLVFLFRISYDEVNRMCLDALKVLFERVRDCQELDIVIHCQGDLEKMVTESVCPILSHGKCLALKVPIEESSDDEYEELHSDDE